MNITVKRNGAVACNLIACATAPFLWFYIAILNNLRVVTCANREVYSIDSELA